MKRLFTTIAVVAMLLCMVPFTAQAAEADTQIEYFEDGSYLVTETEIINTRMLTKVGSKTATYYNANDEIQWKVYVTGEFLYDGTTSTCTYASGTTTIYNTSYWRKNTDYTTYNGNSATYTVIFDYYVLGFHTDTLDCSIPITCDENGNIS